MKSDGGCTCLICGFAWSRLRQNGLIISDRISIVWWGLMVLIRSDEVDRVDNIWWGLYLSYPPLRGARAQRAYQMHKQLNIIKISDEVNLTSSNIYPVLPPCTNSQIWNFKKYRFILYLWYNLCQIHISGQIVSFCRKNKKNLYSRIRR